MKIRLCLSALVAFSLLSCDLFAHSGELRPSTNSKQPDAAVVSSAEDEALPASPPFMIAGPVRSFLRMAGISQKVTPEEVLPLLSRNVFLRGYEGPHHSKQTEFLVLLIRYVRQARELAILAGPQGVLHVSDCVEAKPLLKVLGYRPRPDCGQSNSSLLTEDPERAFIT